MISKHMKRCFISLVFRAVQSKATMSHHYITTGKAKMKKIKIPTVGKNKKQLELAYIAGKNIKRFNCFEK